MKVLKQIVNLSSEEQVGRTVVDENEVEREVNAK